MSISTQDENSQNPLYRRLYLIRPKLELLAKLCITADHPAAAITGVITPRLRYETHFDGWGPAWRSKVRREFVASFIELWSSPFAPAEISAEFLGTLRASENHEVIFDTWWTAEADVDLIEIDPEWRPS
jgi:hypothetical protein